MEKSQKQIAELEENYDPFLTDIQLWQKLHELERRVKKLEEDDA